MGYHREGFTTSMGKSNLKLTIVIVTFHSEQTIVDCINSIISNTKKTDFKIIISDNSYDDNTKIEVLNKFGKDKRVEYFKNDKNIGFSAANNRAIKKAKSEYVLFLNPDTKVYEKTIDGMVDFMDRNYDCGISTCFVELPTGQLDDSSHRGFPTPWRSLSHFSGLAKLFPKSKIFGGYNLSYLDLTKTHKIESAAGSFMLVRWEAGEKIGWWDESFFFYGEDIDFCYRILEKGYQVFFVPEFRALHLKGVSSGIKKVSKEITSASLETRKLAKHHRFRAMEIFYDKHYKDKYPFIVTTLVKLGIKLKKHATK